MDHEPSNSPPPNFKIFMCVGNYAFIVTHEAANFLYRTNNNAYITWRTLFSLDAHADHVMLFIRYF